MSTSLTFPPETVRDFADRLWQRLEPGSLSIPEYIEGNARGTVKRMHGCYYRKEQSNEDQQDTEPVVEPSGQL